jgi:hypothetical protein
LTLRIQAFGLFLQYFWIISLLYFYLYLAVGRVRMRTLIAEGRLSYAEANQFCINTAIALAVVIGAYEGIALGSGIPALCQMTLPFSDKAAWPALLVTVLSGAALLYWVWKRGGDRALARVGPVFLQGAMNKTYTPRQVRTALTALFVLAWGGYFVMRLAMPLPTTFPGCPEA